MLGLVVNCQPSILAHEKEAAPSTPGLHKLVRMPFSDSEVIEGYENFQKFIGSLQKDGSPLIFLFEANEVGGVSWCPDCEKCE